MLKIIRPITVHDKEGKNHLLMNNDETRTYRFDGSTGKIAIDVGNGQEYLIDPDAFSDAKARGDIQIPNEAHP